MKRPYLVLHFFGPPKDDGGGIACDMGKERTLDAAIARGIDRLLRNADKSPHDRIQIRRRGEHPTWLYRDGDGRVCLWRLHPSQPREIWGVHPMNQINVGAGIRPVPGLTSVDLARGRHAANLGFSSGSVDLLFSNAVFEHLYPEQHLRVLEHWSDLLTADGLIIVTGIPDFRRVAALYLAGRLDLIAAQHYTNGGPDLFVREDIATFDPSADPDRGPANWLPECHKALFDEDRLKALLHRSSLTGRVFSYEFPDDGYRANLGFVAFRSTAAVGPWLDRPWLDRFIDRPTVEWRL